VLPTQLCTPGSWYAVPVIVVLVLGVGVAGIWWARAQQRKLNELARQAQLQPRALYADPKGDAIALAEVYLTFGRRADAIRVLEERLKTSPGRLELVEFLNDVRSGKARGFPDPLTGKRLCIFGWIFLGVAAFLVIGINAATALNIPDEQTLTVFRGQLDAPVAFHHEPKRSLQAQFHLTIGRQSSWFHIARLNLLPAQVRNGLAGLPKGAEVTVWAINSSCIDDDGLAVWALSAHGKSILNFATRALVEKDENGRALVVGAWMSLIGLLFLAAHYSWLFVMRRKHTTPNPTVERDAREKAARAPHCER
jgi:hypothetical protein